MHNIIKKMPEPCAVMPAERGNACNPLRDFNNLPTRNQLHAIHPGFYPLRQKNNLQLKAEIRVERLISGGCVVLYKTRFKQRIAGLKIKEKSPFSDDRCQRGLRENPEI